MWWCCFDCSAASIIHSLSNPDAPMIALLAWSPLYFSSSSPALNRYAVWSLTGRTSTWTNWWPPRWKENSTSSTRGLSTPPRASPPFPKRWLQRAERETSGKGGNILKKKKNLQIIVLITIIPSVGKENLSIWAFSQLDAFFWGVVFV